LIFSTSAHHNLEIYFMYQNPLVAATTQGITTVASAATNAAMIGHGSTCSSCIAQGVVTTAKLGSTKIAMTGLMLAHPVTATVVIGGAAIAAGYYIASKFDE
jgi:hypothetical protein